MRKNLTESSKNKEYASNWVYVLMSEKGVARNNYYPLYKEANPRFFRILFLERWQEKEILKFIHKAQDMKIGFFDSGIGGLTISSAVAKLLPQYDYLYLGDSARAPYGVRSQEEIYEFTKQGVTWLFTQGADIVILACNTASSQALRKLQRQWLSDAFGEKKLLGIIIPIAQEAAVHTKGVIGVIGTPATIASQTYIKELRKIRDDIKVVQIAAPEIAELIEQNVPNEKLQAMLQLYLSPLREARVDTLILGCTHYQLVQDIFQEQMGSSVFIPHTGEIVAGKLAEYLEHHPEHRFLLSQGQRQEFFTTGDSSTFSLVGQRFLGTSIGATHIEL